MLERSASRVTVSTRVWPQPGYPFLLDVSAAYALDDDGLAVALTGRNAGDVALPYGVGQHPYVTAGTELVDEAVLTVPAAAWLRTDERGLPESTEPVAGTTVGLPLWSAGRRHGAGHSVRRARPRRRGPRRRTPGAGRRDARRRRLGLGSGTDYLQVFSGDTLAPGRRRRGLAVEPMSCPADAFNSGAGLVRLEPGETHILEWGLHAW